MNHPTLLPCAHCGSPAEFQVNENEGAFGMEYIECSNPLCGMSTLMVQSIGEPVDGKLAEIWNQRVVDSSIRDFIRKFRDLEPDNQKSVRALRLAYSKVHHLANP